LNSLRDFLFNEVSIDNLCLDSIDCNIQIEISTTSKESSSTLINPGSRAYVSGWIKKIKKITHNCRLCVSKLTSDTVLDEHFIIQLRNYSYCKLFLPDKNVNLYSFIIQLFNLNFHHFAYIKRGCSTFKNIIYLSQIIPLNVLTCVNHDLSNMFVNTVCNTLIYSYTDHVNCILSRDEKLNTTDSIKLAANSYYNQYSMKNRILQKNNVNYV